MALECLACNHGNSAGDKFCSACGSSLDLRLCPGCEAVNRRGDTSCHSCGAKLAAEAIVPRRAEAAATAPGRRIGRWIKGAAIALPVAAIAALAAYAYVEPGFAHEVARALRAAATRTVAMAAEVMKRDATGAEAAATSAVSAGLIKEPPPRAAVKMEVKQAPKAEVEQAPKAEVEQAPKAEVEQAPKAASAAPARSTSAPALAAEPALEEPRPAPGGAGRPRVTHTRAVAARPLAEAAPPQPLAEAAPPAVDATSSAVGGGKDESAQSGCPEEVIALGLCSANAKGEGR